MMGYDFAGRTNAQIMATISNGLWIYLAVVLAACAYSISPRAISCKRSSISNK